MAEMGDIYREAGLVKTEGDIFDRTFFVTKKNKVKPGYCKTMKRSLQYPGFYLNRKEELLRL